VTEPSAEEIGPPPVLPSGIIIISFIVCSFWFIGFLYLPWWWCLLNINYNMAVGYKIYLHTNTDQPERHKYKMKSIRKNIHD
jgi:hypothetical protein